MIKYSLSVLTVTTLLLAGSALAADHCAPQMAEAQSALMQAGHAEPNALEAATALMDSAAEACLQEEQLLAYAEADSPMLAPDYVSVGQSMLINVSTLLNGQ